MHYVLTCSSIILLIFQILLCSQAFCLQPFNYNDMMRKLTKKRRPKSGRSSDHSEIDAWFKSLTVIWKVIAGQPEVTAGYLEVWGHHMLFQGHDPLTSLHLTVQAWYINRETLKLSNNLWPAKQSMLWKIEELFVGMSLLQLQIKKISLNLKYIWR